MLSTSQPGNERRLETKASDEVSDFFIQHLPVPHSSKAGTHPRPALVQHELQSMASDSSQFAYPSGPVHSTELLPVKDVQPASHASLVHHVGAPDNTAAAGAAAEPTKTTKAGTWYRLDDSEGIFSLITPSPKIRSDNKVTQPGVLASKESLCPVESNQPDQSAAGLSAAANKSPSQQGKDHAASSLADASGKASPSSDRSQDGKTSTGHARSSLAAPEIIRSPAHQDHVQHASDVHVDDMTGDRPASPTNANLPSRADKERVNTASDVHVDCVSASGAEAGRASADGMATPAADSAAGAATHTLVPQAGSSLAIDPLAGDTAASAAGTAGAVTHTPAVEPGSASADEAVAGETAGSAAAAAAAAVTMHVEAPHAGSGCAEESLAAKHAPAEQAGGVLADAVLAGGSAIDAASAITLARALQPVSTSPDEVLAGKTALADVAKAATHAPAPQAGTMQAQLMQEWVSGADLMWCTDRRSIGADPAASEQQRRSSSDIVGSPGKAVRASPKNHGIGSVRHQAAEVANGPRRPRGRPRKHPVDTSMSVAGTKEPPTSSRDHRMAHLPHGALLRVPSLHLPSKASITTCNEQYAWRGKNESSLGISASPNRNLAFVVPGSPRVEWHQIDMAWPGRTQSQPRSPTGRPPFASHNARPSVRERCTARGPQHHAIGKDAFGVRSHQQSGKVAHPGAVHSRARIGRGGFDFNNQRSHASLERAMPTTVCMPAGNKRHTDVPSISGAAGAAAHDSGVDRWEGRAHVDVCLQPQQAPGRPTGLYSFQPAEINTGCTFSAAVHPSSPSRPDDPAVCNDGSRLEAEETKGAGGVDRHAGRRKASAGVSAAAAAAIESSISEWTSDSATDEPEAPVRAHFEAHVGVNDYAALAAHMGTSDFAALAAPRKALEGPPEPVKRKRGRPRKYPRVSPAKYQVAHVARTAPVARASLSRTPMEDACQVLAETLPNFRRRSAGLVASPVRQKGGAVLVDKTVGKSVIDRGASDGGKPGNTRQQDGLENTPAERQAGLGGTQGASMAAAVGSARKRSPGRSVGREWSCGDVPRGDDMRRYDTVQGQDGGELCSVSTHTAISNENPADASGAASRSLEGGFCFRVNGAAGNDLSEHVDGKIPVQPKKRPPGRPRKYPVGVDLAKVAPAARDKTKHADEADKSASASVVKDGSHTSPGTAHKDSKPGTPQARHARPATAPVSITDRVHIGGVDDGDARVTRSASLQGATWQGDWEQPRGRGPGHRPKSGNQPSSASPSEPPVENRRSSRRGNGAGACDDDALQAQSARTPQVEGNGGMMLRRTTERHGSGSVPETDGYKGTFAADGSGPPPGAGKPGQLPKPCGPDADAPEERGPRDRAYPHASRDGLVVNKSRARRDVLDGGRGHQATVEGARTRRATRPGSAGAAVLIQQQSPGSAAENVSADASPRRAAEAPNRTKGRPSKRSRLDQSPEENLPEAAPLSRIRTRSAGGEKQFEKPTADRSKGRPQKRMATSMNRAISRETAPSLRSGPSDEIPPIKRRRGRPPGSFKKKHETPESDAGPRGAHAAAASIGVACKTAAPPTTAGVSTEPAPLPQEGRGSLRSRKSNNTRSTRGVATQDAPRQAIESENESRRPGRQSKHNSSSAAHQLSPSQSERHRSRSATQLAAPSGGFEPLERARRATEHVVSHDTPATKVAAAIDLSTVDEAALARLGLPPPPVKQKIGRPSKQFLAERAAWEVAAAALVAAAHRGASTHKAKALKEATPPPEGPADQQRPRHADSHERRGKRKLPATVEDTASLRQTEPGLSEHSDEGLPKKRGPGRPRKKRAAESVPAVRQSAAHAHESSEVPGDAEAATPTAGPAMDPNGRSDAQPDTVAAAYTISNAAPRHSSHDLSGSAAVPRQVDKADAAQAAGGNSHAVELASAQANAGPAAMSGEYHTQAVLVQQPSVHAELPDISHHASSAAQEASEETASAWPVSQAHEAHGVVASDVDNSGALPAGRNALDGGVTSSIALPEQLLKPHGGGITQGKGRTALDLSSERDADGGARPCLVDGIAAKGPVASDCLPPYGSERVVDRATTAGIVHLLAQAQPSSQAGNVCAGPAELLPRAADCALHRAAPPTTAASSGLLPKHAAASDGTAAATAFRHSMLDTGHAHPTRGASSASVQSCKNDERVKTKNAPTDIQASELPRKRRGRPPKPKHGRPRKRGASGGSVSRPSSAVPLPGDAASSERALSGSRGSGAKMSAGTQNLIDQIVTSAAAVNAQRPSSSTDVLPNNTRDLTTAVAAIMPPRMHSHMERSGAACAGVSQGTSMPGLTQSGRGVGRPHMFLEDLVQQAHHASGVPLQSKDGRPADSQQDAAILMRAVEQAQQLASVMHTRTDGSQESAVEESDGATSEGEDMCSGKAASARGKLGGESREAAVATLERLLCTGIDAQVPLGARQMAAISTKHMSDAGAEPSSSPRGRSRKARPLRVTPSSPGSGETPPELPQRTIRSRKGPEDLYAKPAKLRRHVGGGAAVHVERPDSSPISARDAAELLFQLSQTAALPSRPASAHTLTQERDTSPQGVVASAQFREPYSEVQGGPASSPPTPELLPGFWEVHCEFSAVGYPGKPTCPVNGDVVVARCVSRVVAESSIVLTVATYPTSLSTITFAVRSATEGPVVRTVLAEGLSEKWYVAHCGMRVHAGDVQHMACAFGPHAWLAYLQPHHEARTQ